MCLHCLGLASDLPQAFQVREAIYILRSVLADDSHCHLDTPSTLQAFRSWDALAHLSFGLLSSSPSNPRDTHLLGQHTVRMSPISTAHLNPQGVNFCLSPTNNFVLLPVLLNNTNLAGLKYTYTPLSYTNDGSRGKVETHELSAKDLKQVEQTYHERLQLVATGQSARTTEEYDEYDDDDDGSNPQSTQSTLQQTQTLVHIPLSRPGVVRLEQVYDSSNADARLVISEAVVVPCPRVEFADDDTSASQNSIRCAGQDVDLQLKISVHGVPPLSLRWLKLINGNQEKFLVEGIEADHKDKHLQVDDGAPTETSSSLATTQRRIDVQDVNIPLTISLDKSGTYLYALEEITDGVGNVVRVESDPISLETHFITQTKTTRSFMVLKKPVVSFAHCSSEMPTSLLIGSEATLTIKSIEYDIFDAPWDISLSYQPPVDIKSTKQMKPWKKTLKAEAKSLTFSASTPGDYKILGVTGKVSTVISLQYLSLKSNSSLVLCRNRFCT